MKTFTYHLICTAFCLSIHLFAIAQISNDLLTNLDVPVGILQVDDELYYTEYIAGTISKIDLSDPDAIPALVASGIGGPYGLERDEQYLYFSGLTDLKLYRLDIQDPNASPEIVVDMLSSPVFLILVGDTLFVSAIDGISTIDLSDPNPTLIPFLSTPNPVTTLSKYGDDLYFHLEGNENELGVIQKISLTAEDPMVETVLSGLGLSGGFTIMDDELYLTQALDNSILKLDLTDDQATLELVLLGLETPYTINVFDGVFYLTQIGSSTLTPGIGKISSLEFLTTSTTIHPKESFSLYPNPAMEVLMVDVPRREQNGQLVNSLGQPVGQIQLQSGLNELRIDHLIPGIYFLILESGQSLQFMKVNP